MSARRKLRRVDSVAWIIRLRQFLKKGRSRPESEVTRALRANSQTMDMPAENNERPPFSPVSGHTWGGLPAALYELRSTAQNALSDLYFATAEKLHQRLSRSNRLPFRIAARIRSSPIAVIMKMYQRRSNRSIIRGSHHAFVLTTCQASIGKAIPPREGFLRAGRPKSRSQACGMQEKTISALLSFASSGFAGRKGFRSFRAAKALPRLGTQNEAP